MARWHSYPSGVRRDTRSGLRVHLPASALSVVVLCMVVHACGGQLLVAPEDIRLLTISGYVYGRETPESGEPALAGALITVQEAEAPPQTTISNGVGFYTVSVRAGTISVTASKLGYTTRGSSFDMSTSTVLSFFLIPS